MTPTEIEVPIEAAGERLDRFLAIHVGSRAAAERAVERGALVDGLTRPKSYRLEGGETISVTAELAPAARSIDHLPTPTIAWGDEHLAVIDKPAGLVVHAGAGVKTGTLVDVLASILAGGDPERPGIVHRLDRDTSGLMVVAKSEAAHERLTQLVRERALERTYLTLVHGRPRSRMGRIDAPIGRDRDDPLRMSLDSDSLKDAVTHFEIEHQYPAHTLLRVKLETGRTHQIRVHLAAIGLPVMGDTVYGVPAPALGRQFLHATELAFPHPLSEEPIDVHSPLPEDLQDFLASLET
jgi:23S rRNA pseudouridine1911/1915/1917 synthase